MDRTSPTFRPDGRQQALGPHAMLSTLRRFVRGDVALDEFAAWVYGQPALEELLGEVLYLQLISTDFRDSEEVASTRAALGPFLQQRRQPPPACFCARIPDGGLVPFGSAGLPTPDFDDDRECNQSNVRPTLEEIRRKGGRQWWLGAYRCKHCKQAWLVGSEERLVDVDCMQRLDEGEVVRIANEDIWPTDFDSYETLLRRSHGFCTLLVGRPPLRSKIGETLVDLARARPGISVDDLSWLLHLDRDHAETLARQAIAEHGVDIALELH